VRLSLREAFPMYFGERWEAARDIYLGRFREIHLERLTALPGRKAMLRAIAGQGIYLGLVSNKSGDLLRREVDRLGWTGFFGAIVGAGDAPLDKPACEPVHLALAPSGIAAGEEVWFVGDTAVDMECAHNSGCIPVLLGEAASPEEFAREFAHFAPLLSFADEAGLFQLLQGLRSEGVPPIS
jgi:phosphoglycolate phosphatase